jgi:hypothetical protein
MTAEHLSWEAQQLWGELVLADRHGWEIAELSDSDRATAFRELVDADLSDERQELEAFGEGVVYFRLTDHGRRLGSAEP